ncbi:MAG: ABC transporter ATP-binding protein, partial [Geobacteraceae bacterium]
MSNVRIRVENISKKYLISVKKKAEEGTSSGSGGNRIKDVLAQCGLMSGQDLMKEELWPLKNVSFEINSGEVVGIIGRNGAGKSTLLKILSRITEPTDGRAEIFGRVGTLLEVGTGFHPELTGRENIYLSGIILGMKRTEIDRKFDEIVEFAGVSKFIDTPVKRYSSGMYVRLAFAVGAHLEPEILIVDEVLAVGDAQFQKKCLDKMRLMGSEGRTVLFVSHN